MKTPRRTPAQGAPGSLPLIVRLVARLVPAQLRDNVLGDVAEEYRHRRATVGRLRALSWCCRQLLSPDLLRLRRELRGPAPPSRSRTTMSDLLIDLRYCFRTLRAAPLLTSAVVLTLALGVGANAAVFTVIDATLLAPLPYRDADELVFVWETHRDFDEPTTVAPANYVDWRRQSTTLEDLAAFNLWFPTLSGDGDPEIVEGSVVTANFFDVLGVSAQLGSTFRPEHGIDGNDDVVILSDGLWRRRFGGDPQIVGRAIQVGGTPHTVIGVMPPDYRQPERSAISGTEIWSPIPLATPTRSARYLRTIGRLADGSDIEQARQELAAIAARLQEQYPESNDGFTTMVVPVREELIGGSRDALLLLLGAAAFLLLIVCSNVANLLLSRGQQRRREMAIRAALGAGRGRLVRQVLFESLALAALGSVLGLAFVVAGGGLLRTVQASLFPSLPEVAVDHTVAGFTALIGTLAALLFGAAPAAEMSRADLRRTMNEGTAGAGTGAAARRLRAALVVVEVALATVLLIGAGLLTRSFFELGKVDPGFDADGVLVFELSAPRARYPDNADLMAFFERMLERFAAVPGVQAADLFSDLPFTSSNWGLAYRVESATDLPASQLPTSEYHIVGPQTFEVLRIPLQEGRLFDGRDGPEAPAVAVVNRTLAEQLAPDGDPVGKSVQIGAGAPSDPAVTVIGVVGDTLDDGFESVPGPRMFMSYRQRPNGSTGVVVRVAGEPTSIVPALRRELAAIDPQIAMADVKTLREHLDDTVSARRLGLLLVNVFTALALLLACVGIFGVMAYAVARRSREIAIRGALGARGGHLIAMVVGESMTLAGIGIAIGTAGGLVLGRVIAAMLFAITPTDPLTFLAAPLVLGMVALAASALPARRAQKLSPMTVLRRM